METPVYYKRQTANYYIFEAPTTSEGEIQVIYLPKRIFKFPDPIDSMNLILSKRKVHVCNCEYCTRSEK